MWFSLGRRLISWFKAALAPFPADTVVGRYTLAAVTPDYLVVHCEQPDFTWSIAFDSPQSLNSYVQNFADGNPSPVCPTGTFPYFDTFPLAVQPRN
jgi:hypothetical protein